MARSTTRYVCQGCGAVYPRWQGHCESCGEWNSIAEEAVESAPPIGGKAKGGTSATNRRGKAVEFVALDGANTRAPRLKSGIAEYDRVLGGGLVEGSAVLIGGDPGIGKSTLLLQVTAALARAARVAYISGEEAIDQVRMRADRLGVKQATVDLAAATSVPDILAAIDRNDGPKVVVIDSIQTMYVDLLDSAPGTVGQVRAAAQELIRVAKRRGIALLLVGHVTKEGAIAGPRVLEHMVDTVLYFEGERGHPFRILRGVKNRFGPTDEIGVFDMTEQGLQEVKNPSALFLADRQEGIAGAAVFAGIEGSRPMLVEIQALVAPSAYGTPRRAVVGWDSNRLAMLLAVLEARAGLDLGGRDVYLNVAGGLRISEPAADLAVAAAIASSLTGEAVPGETVVFGEIGLSGEVRTVGRADARLKEAAKLGFKRAIVPRRPGKDGPDRKGGKNDGALGVTEVADVGRLASLLAGDGTLDGPLP
ncbi:DNA repair protein RadA [Marivibrio halodurans]|uniref:DNA repair protein RadA n=1 Tax=Marivibrio halodurans TaxID=2039722 RepID=A0A8J7S5F1_9PROT|nr:DNA repair protein RadA [Marivibrio halodurans]MBP5855907.1 DNA repair protein RadA [Marivibrio halodurans]